MKRNTAIVALVLVIGGAVAASALLPPTAWRREDEAKRKEAKTSQTKAKEQPPVPYKLPFKFNGFADVGDPGAKIVITAGMPGQQAHTCQTVENTVYVVWALAQKNPGRIRAVFVDFESAEGAAKAKEHGVQAGCAGIQINGQQKVTVQYPNEDPFEIELSHSMGDAFKPEDFVQAVAGEFQRQYGVAMKRPDLQKALTDANKAAAARTGSSGLKGPATPLMRGGPLTLPPGGKTPAKQGG